MIKDIIWLLPIVCLLGSILYYSARLWWMCKKEIYTFAQRMLAKFGFWKIGVGRLNRLQKYGCWYIVSAILSILIFCVASFMTKAKVIEEITTFAERLGIIEFGKFSATFGFAVITVVESLLMHGCDFSEIKLRLSKLESFLGRIFFTILPGLIWILTGFAVYKDYFFRTANEWISSPGRVFQLCWGVVSMGIFWDALSNVIQDVRES